MRPIIIASLTLFIAVSVVTFQNCAKDGSGGSAVMQSSSGTALSCQTEAAVAAVTSDYTCLVMQAGHGGPCCIPRGAGSALYNVPPVSQVSHNTDSIVVHGSGNFLACSDDYQSKDDLLMCWDYYWSQIPPATSSSCPLRCSSYDSSKSTPQLNALSGLMLSNIRSIVY